MPTTLSSIHTNLYESLWNLKLEKEELLPISKDGIILFGAEYEYPIQILPSENLTIKQLAVLISINSIQYILPSELEVECEAECDNNGEVINWKKFLITNESGDSMIIQGVYSRMYGWTLRLDLNYAFDKLVKFLKKDYKTLLWNYYTYQLCGDVPSKPWIRQDQLTKFKVEIL